MSMLNFLEEEGKWRLERILGYEKKILQLKDIPVPNSFSLDRYEIDILIDQQKEWIEHNQTLIKEYEEAKNDTDLQEIDKNIKDKSNLKTVHIHLLYGAYSKLKKFKQSKLDADHKKDYENTLKNAYTTISPFLETATSYVIQYTHKS